MKLLLHTPVVCIGALVAGGASPVFAQSLQAVRHGAEDLAAVVFASSARPGPSEKDPYTTEEHALY
jgi:trimethylamine:corrinoid methyltransferase-like protein